MTRRIPRIGLEGMRRPLVRTALTVALVAPATLLGPVGFAEPVAEERLEAVDRAQATRWAGEYDIPVALAGSIQQAAVAEGVPLAIAFGLVATESSFRQKVVSPMGAVGYTQVLPSTARWLDPAVTRASLFAEETNLRIGFRYLNYLFDYYDGDLRLAVTAYNRGPGTVDKLLAVGRDPENGYADRVLPRFRS